jgi:hypothetical protein
MFDSPAVHLAVATLRETEAAASFRQDPDRPMHGYCLLTSDGQDCRVGTYLENARPLTERSPAGAFYYEAWIVTSEEPLSLTAFNAGAAGEGSGTCVRAVERLGLDRAIGIRITAEPFGGTPSGATPMLEGSLVWLQEQPASQSHPEPEAAAPPEAGEAEENPPDGGAEPEEAEAEVPLSVAAEAVSASSATPDGPPKVLPWQGMLSGPTTMFHPLRDPGAGPGERFEDDSPAPSPVQPPPPEEEPVETGFKLIQEPATPVLRTQRPDIKFAFSSLHPLAPRGGGSAHLDRTTSTVTLTLWGLPSPASLGREKSTNRPFNAYQVWLQNQRSGQKTPMGICTRVWGENFRFQAEADHPLTSFDSILVTALDRTSSGAQTGAPQVLLGRYASE